MKTTMVVVAVLTFLGSGPAAAEDCETLMSDYQEMLRGKVDLLAPDPHPNEQVRESMRLFEQGAGQCQGGQREEAELTLKQAIAALSAE